MGRRTNKRQQKKEREEERDDRFRNGEGSQRRRLGARIARGDLPNEGSENVNSDHQKKGVENNAERRNETVDGHGRGVF
jgi:hypothetical protein